MVKLSTNMNTSRTKVCNGFLCAGSFAHHADAHRRASENSQKTARKQVDQGHGPFI